MSASRPPSPCESAASPRTLRGMDTPSPFLTAAHVEALPPSAPECVHLIPAGAFSGRDGRGVYTLDAAACREAFSRHGMPVAIDYEHQSISCAENGQPAPAAGWITAVEAREDGLWGTVEWTVKAAAMIAAREYRYLSPVFFHDAAGRVLGLQSAGLTNFPNLALTAINRRADVSTHSTLTHGADMNEILERLRYLFNLPTLADEAAIVAELDKLKARLAAPEAAAMREALKLPADAGVAKIVEAVAAHRFEAPAPKAPEEVGIAAMRAEVENLKAQTLAVQKAIDDKKIDEAIGAALAAHRITPAQAESARETFRASPESFAKFLASVPVTRLAAQTAAHTAGAPAAPVHPLLADAARRAK